MRTTERLAPATGIAGIVLFLVSTVIVPTPPKASEPAAKVTRYLAEHGSTLRAAQYLSGLAVLALLFFLGTLWSHLRRAEGPAGPLAQTFLVAGTAISTVFLMQSGMLVVATYEPASAGSVSLLRLAVELAPHTAFLFGPMVGAVGLLVLRHGGLPRALAVYSVGFALYELIEAACVINRSGALAPGGAFNVVGPFLFSLWVVWASVALLQATGSSSPRSATTPSASVL